MVNMGYIVDQERHRPDPAKTLTLMHAPAPRSVAELQSYLEMLNYYGKFIPQMATLLEPLYSLLRHGEKWLWAKKQEEAFRISKEKLCAAPVLVHYHPKWPVRVACDASPFGVGAILSHALPDGSEHPAAFA